MCTFMYDFNNAATTSNNNKYLLNSGPIKHMKPDVGITRISCKNSIRKTTAQSYRIYASGITCI